jgi:hypothetical protein
MYQKSQKTLETVKNDPLANAAGVTVYIVDVGTVPQRGYLPSTTV